HCRVHCCGRLTARPAGVAHTCGMEPSSPGRLRHTRVLVVLIVVFVAVTDVVAVTIRWYVDHDIAGGGTAAAVRGVLAFGVAAAVGAVIVVRRPGNRTGRVLL